MGARDKFGKPAGVWTARGLAIAVASSLITLSGCWGIQEAPPSPPPPLPSPWHMQPVYGSLPRDDRAATASGTVPTADPDLVIGRTEPVTSSSMPAPITGRFAYGAPSVMIVDQPYFLSVSISAPQTGETTPQLDARLAQDTRETLGSDSGASIRAGDVQIGSIMSASLTGVGFDIADLSDPKQTIDPQGVTRWLWEVRATATGRTGLVMRLTAHDSQGEPLNVTRIVPAIIDVRAEADAFLSQGQMAERSAGGAPAPVFPPRPDPIAPMGFAAPASSVRLAADACTTSAGAADRLALVIGNETYTGITRLAHAKSDGVLVRDVLAESGFRVTHCEDLDADQLPNALHAFREQVKAAAADREVAAAFYYAGHGASTPTQNETYLLPVSLRQATVAQIEAQGVSIGQIVGGLSKAGARRLIVVIDACRDLLQVEDGQYRGFHVLNWRSSAYDIVAYATMWGEKARDNGVYATALAKAIRDMPGVDVADVLNRVQTAVSDATSEDQVPQYNDRMPGVFAIRN